MTDRHGDRGAKLKYADPGARFLPESADKPPPACHGRSDAVMISLTQTAILLAAAVVAVPLFRFLRLSSILGYVVAGLVIGPWGLGLIGDVGHIMHVAEFRVGL